MRGTKRECDHPNPNPFGHRFEGKVNHGYPPHPEVVKVDEVRVVVVQLRGWEDERAVEHGCVHHVLADAHQTVAHLRSDRGGGGWGCYQMEGVGIRMGGWGEGEGGGLCCAGFWFTDVERVI